MPDTDNVYLSLLTSQHAQKPRFRATVDAVTRPLLDAATALSGMAAGFDLDTAAGAQLDVLGAWAGVSRVLRLPMTGVYFALDTDGVGFDQGVWQGRYDPDYGLTMLPDEQYRVLIKARIAANRWDGTIPHAYEIWETLFTDSVIFIEDHQDMSMVVGIAGIPLDPVFEQLLTGGYIPLKPDGVRVNFFAVGTESGPLFGFDCDSDALAGFDIGQFPVEVQPLR